MADTPRVWTGRLSESPSTAARTARLEGDVMGENITVVVERYSQPRDGLMSRMAVFAVTAALVSGCAQGAATSSPPSATAPSPSSSVTPNTSRTCEARQSGQGGTGGTRPTTPDAALAAYLEADPTLPRSAWHQVSGDDMTSYDNAGYTLRFRRATTGEWLIDYYEYCR